jgi:putative ABC transport system permease protein
MLWLALRQLLGRRTATALAGGGLLIATLGFVTLVSTSQTVTTELSGDIARTWNTPYDLLVRPADSTTELEDERGLVRSNFLSALARGGITPGQLEAIRRVPGVAVAAPVAVAGAVNWPAGGFGTDLSAEPVGDPLAVFRFSVSSIVDAGRSTYAVETHYLVVAIEGVVRYAEGSRDAVLTVRDRRIGCKYPVSCFAPTVCEQDDCRPAADPPSYGLEILQPIVIAGIDPVAEAQLAGLDRCVTAGRYLSRADVPQPLPDRDPPGTRIPALVSERSFVDETLIGRLERADDAAVVLAGGSPTRLAGWQDVRVETTTAAELYAEHLPRVAQDVDEWPMWSIGDVGYEAGPGGRLNAVPRPADLSVYDRNNFRLVGQGEQLATPPAARDTWFREVTAHTYQRFTGNRYWAPVGRYDPDCLPGFDPLAGGRLETYSAPVARLPDGQTLLPNRSLGGYLNSPPLVLTTLDGAAWLADPTRFSDRPGDAYLSVIRVKLAGVGPPGPAARAKLARVAADIHDATGLRVDVVKGASPQEVSVGLPAGQFGRPALTLREPWAVKGVALRFTEAVSAQNVAVFAIALVTATILVSLTAYISVRRRRAEFAVLRALGWPARRIGALVVLEMLTLGVTVGVLAVLLGAPLVGWLGGHVLGWTVAAAIPAALVVSAVAALPPAISASRGSTAEVMVRRGRVRRSRLPYGPATVGLRDIVGLWRREAILGAVAVALGAAMFGLVLLVTEAFRGSLDLTVLGVYLGGRVRPFHIAIAVLTVVIGAMAAGQVVTLGYLERQAQLAALRSLGWSRRHLLRLLGAQGLAIGAAGGGIGAGVSWLGGIVLAAPPAAIVQSTVASLAVALVATAVAITGPLAHAYRAAPAAALREA